MHHSKFVHLHLHTQYSLLDGAITIDALCEKARHYRMPAIAVTDHGNLYGAIEFYQKATKAGIKPIIGCEAYIQSHGSRRDKQIRRGVEPYHHLTLLAMNHTGYQNLCRLVTAAHLEGFYYKPRIDKELLRQYGEGLIVLSGCLSGELAEAALQGGVPTASRVAEEYRQLFGDRFYLEIQENGLESQTRFNEIVKQVAQELSLPLVATNDCHYLKAEDAEAHEALLCIQTGKTVQDQDRMRFGSDAFYLRSAEEMQALFASHPEAIRNTIEIAERCNLDLDFKSYHFPRFDPPAGKTLENFLEEQTWAGFEERWKVISKSQTNETRERYEARLKQELEMIQKTGFAGYFLIVADFINYAKGEKIPVGPGRGSATGSLVAYCLKITDLDPMPYHLLFERFLNPERISMPDMDIDFCMDRRDEVIHYVQKKYGNVAQIITFGKMKAKAVVRDVGRVLNMPYGEVDRIAKMIPNALNITLEEALRLSPPLQELSERDPIKNLISIARSLEGLNRHASTHAAGVVISDRPLVDFLPLSRGQNGEIVTQYDMKAIEAVGLIKFDFLGLKTLTVIDHTLKIIRRTRGIEISMDQIPLDDTAVYQALATGNTTGIFQLESSGMRELIIKLKPTSFPDLIALVALYRPGPLGSGMVDDFINRKHGRVRVRYELDLLEPILRETYGVIVYQEQVMQIASTLAQFSLGDADILRRAMGKKKPEEMAEQKDKFIKGCVTSKMPVKKAEKIFDLMAKFAEYGFNKCVVAETELIDAQTGKIFTVADLIGEGPDRFTFSCDEAYQLVPRRIVSVTSSGFQRIFRLKTELGHEILVTANHPFLTLGGWRKLEELRNGDRIAVPRVLRLEGKLEISPHELITLGWLLSEGNLCHPSSLYFYNNDRATVDDFVEAVSKFPHTKARVTQRPDGRFEVCVNTGTRSHVPWNAHRLAALQEERPPLSGVFRWAERLGLIEKKAGQKFIPQNVFLLTHRQIALFLGRLWSGDGFVFGPNNSVPFYATASATLARQVQFLLLRLGIPSRCVEKSFRYRGGNKKGYAVYVTGEDATRTFMDEIGPFMVGREGQLKKLGDNRQAVRSGQASRDTIPWEVKKIVRKEKERIGRTWNQIEMETGLSMKEFIGGEHPCKKGFRRKTILQLGEYFGSEILRNLGRSDLYWDRVGEITEAGGRETYDLTVEENHNFVANGIVVHNSHSAAYAFISYQTAYLKTHFPVEYIASLLTHEMANTDKVMTYIADCREAGISILPPDINQSFTDFSVVGEREIRFGLAAVKNVGVAAIESILEARKREGEFRSFIHCCESVDLRKVNRRVLEGLIKCGAFDALQIKRSQALSVLDQALERGGRIQKERATGQGGLFGSLMEDIERFPVPEIPEWGIKERLTYEKESLGFYITGHPLDEYRRELPPTDSRQLQAMRESQQVTIGGVVAQLKEVITKNSDRMAFVTLEDLKGTIQVIVFPELYKRSLTLLKEQGPIVVRGETDVGEDSVKILAREIAPLTRAEGPLRGRLDPALPVEGATRAPMKEVHFHLPGQVTREQMGRLKSVLTQHRGTSPAFIHLKGGVQGETILSLPDEVDPSPELVTEVDSLFETPVTSLH